MSPSLTNIIQAVVGTLDIRPSVSKGFTTQRRTNTFLTRYRYMVSYKKRGKGEYHTKDMLIMI